MIFIYIFHIQWLLILSLDSDPIKDHDPAVGEFPECGYRTAGIPTHFASAGGTSMPHKIAIPIEWLHLIFLKLENIFVLFLHIQLSPSPYQYVLAIGPLVVSSRFDYLGFFGKTTSRFQNTTKTTFLSTI